MTCRPWLIKDLIVNCTRPVVRAVACIAADQQKDPKIRVGMIMGLVLGRAGKNKIAFFFHALIPPID